MYVDENNLPKDIIPPKAKKSENSDPPWIVSFIDTLSLLVTFFVLLFSMSTIDKETWQDVINSFDTAFENADKTANSGNPIEQAIPEILRNRAINLRYLGRILQTQIEKNDLQANITIKNLDDRLVIALPSDLLFESSQASLRPEARNVLVIVGSLLRNVRNKIEIYGHTDPNQIRYAREYANNWELSLARSLTLSDTLKAMGLRRQIAVLGFADAKFADLPKSLPQSEKFALSRRVDIVIYPYVK